MRLANGWWRVWLLWLGLVVFGRGAAHGASPPAGTNPYALLGVAPTATTADIQTAARGLLRRHHPDGPCPDAAVFAQVAEARSMLTDPASRLAFDQRGGACDMDEVVPGLFLGSAQAANASQALALHGVGAVVSLGVQASLGMGVEVLRVDVEDREEENLLVHLADVLAFVDRARESGGGVLVHCRAGMSRSVSVVAAYLMTRFRLPLRTALGVIAHHRAVPIRPNPGFLSQLRTLELAGLEIAKAVALWAAANDGVCARVVGPTDRHALVGAVRDVGEVERVVARLWGGKQRRQPTPLHRILSQ